MSPSHGDNLSTRRHINYVAVPGHLIQPPVALLHLSLLYLYLGAGGLIVDWFFTSPRDRDLRWGSPCMCGFARRRGFARSCRRSPVEAGGEAGQPSVVCGDEGDGGSWATGRGLWRRGGRFGSTRQCQGRTTPLRGQIERPASGDLVAGACLYGVRRWIGVVMLVGVSQSCVSGGITAWVTPRQQWIGVSPIGLATCIRVHGGIHQYLLFDVCIDSWSFRRRGYLALGGGGDWIF